MAYGISVCITKDEVSLQQQFIDQDNTHCRLSDILYSSRIYICFIRDTLHFNDNLMQQTSMKDTGLLHTLSHMYMLPFVIIISNQFIS